MANVLGFAGLGVTIAAFIFALLALALPYWVTYEQGPISINGGLWTSCTDNSVAKTCTDPADTEDEDLESDVKATRAMVVLGFILVFAAIIPVVLLLFVMKDKKILGFIGGGLAIAGGLFLMVGFALYADRIKVDLVDYHAGFAFCIMGWIAAWIAGALIIFAAIKGDGS